MKIRDNVLHLHFIKDSISSEATAKKISPNSHLNFEPNSLVRIAVSQIEMSKE